MRHAKETTLVWLVVQRVAVHLVQALYYSPIYYDVEIIDPRVLLPLDMGIIPDGYCGNNVHLLRMKRNGT